jgi:hypothetical protein
MEYLKKSDRFIGVLVFFVTGLLIYLLTRPLFLEFATNYKLVGGFIKFFILASIGDFIGYRLKNKHWAIPKNMFFKALIWGLIGVVIVMMFVIFPTGVSMLQEKGLLPFYGNTFFHALFTSIFMNVIFAPTMMLFHRISDTYLELDVSLRESIKHIDLNQFVYTVLFKTIPLFWIPAHTVTFLIPEEYRIILAAILGIFLGLLLSIFKK